MSEFKNKMITTKGMELLSQALSGGSLEFTRIEMGAGGFVGDLGAAESLVQIKQSLPITKITRKGSQVTLSATLKIEDITSEYDWSEIGVYAKGNDGVEVLYLYGYTQNTSFISKDSLNEKLINITVMVSNAAEVTALIDDSLIYLTREALDEHSVDQEAHQDIREALANIDISWEGIAGKPENFPPSSHNHHNTQFDNPTLTGMIQAEQAKIDVGLNQNKLGRYSGDTTGVWNTSSTAKEHANVIFHDVGEENWSGIICDAGGNLLAKAGTHGSPTIRLTGSELQLKCNLINSQGHSVHGTYQFNTDISGQDLNNVIYPNTYKGSNLRNVPTALHGWWYVEVMAHASTWICQRVTDLHDPTNQWIRSRSDSGWGEWSMNNNISLRKLYAPTWNARITLTNQVEVLRNKNHKKYYVFNPKYNGFIRIRAYTYSKNTSNYGGGGFSLAREVDPDLGYVGTNNSEAGINDRYVDLWAALTSPLGTEIGTLVGESRFLVANGTHSSGQTNFEKSGVIAVRAGKPILFMVQAPSYSSCDAYGITRLDIMYDEYAM